MGEMEGEGREGWEVVQKLFRVGKPTKSRRHLARSSSKSYHSIGACPLWAKFP